MVYITVFIIVLCIQLFHITFYASSEYVADELYYYSAVNDTVYMDQIYAKTDITGYIPEKETSELPQELISIKQYIAPWYTFFSYVAATSHIRPIVVCHTLMPPIMTIMIYLTLHIFAEYFFPDNPDKIHAFLMWSAILFSAFSYSLYLFHLAQHVSAWGKVIAAFIGIPILLLIVSSFTFDQIQTIKCIKWDCLLLSLCSLGAATMAASVMMIASVGLFFSMILHFAKFRNLNIILYAFFAELPFILQLAIWYFVLKA